MQQYEQLKKENLMKYDQEPPSAPGVYLIISCFARVSDFIFLNSNDDMA